MPTLRPARHNLRSTIALTANKPSYAAGLRAAIATILPLVLAASFGSTAGTWLSLGGFSASLADRGGSYWTRATTMTALSLSCAVAVILGTVGGNHHTLVVPLTFVVALVASLARVWGNGGASIGGSTLSTFAIAIAYPATFDDALSRAGFIIAGGAWAMAVALTLWPLRPYRPARLAVAASWRALADYAEEAISDLGRSRISGTREYPVSLPMVRATLENARDVLAQVRQGRAGTSTRGDQLIVIAQAADQLFGHIVGAAESVESIPKGERDPQIEATIRAQLQLIAATARQIAEATEEENEPQRIPVEFGGAPIMSQVESGLVEPADSGAFAALHYSQVATILDRSAQYAGVAARTATALNGKRSSEVPAPAILEEPEERVSLLVHLRAILSPGSLLFRYAMRVAVVTSAAVLLAQVLGIKRGYWMTLTVIVILQPYTGITTQRALQRVLGTILGGILTAALGAVIHDPRAIMVVAFVFVTLCVALLPVNYVAFSIFLTPTFVLLAEASAGDWHLASTRVLNTLIGGALAWIGSRILWPSPEASRMPGYMTASLRANRDYLNAVAERFDDRSEAAGAAILNARRATGLAASNTDESFQRFLGEHTGPNEDLAAAMTFMTYSRRLIASIAALALARHAIEQPAGEAVRPALARAAGVLDDLADSVESGDPPKPMRPLPQLSSDERQSFPLLYARLERITRQLSTLHDSVERWSAPIESHRNSTEAHASQQT
jgi:uncharacterized membrane protein YccC